MISVAYNGVDYEEDRQYKILNTYIIKFSTVLFKVIVSGWRSSVYQRGRFSTPSVAINNNNCASMRSIILLLLLLTYAPDRVVLGFAGWLKCNRQLEEAEVSAANCKTTKLERYLPLNLPNSH